MHIEHAVPEQLDALMDLYEQARAFMRATGNPNQWGTTNPPVERVQADILAGYQYVCVENGEILATFFYLQGEEPTYKVIEQGGWLNDLPYGVAHRVCVAKQGGGVGGFCLDWCFRQCGNMRIDTHRDNQPMQHLLQKCGFTLCGEITVANGTKRLAYQRSGSAATSSPSSSSPVSRNPKL